MAPAPIPSQCLSLASADKDLETGHPGPPSCCGNRGRALSCGLAGSKSTSSSCPGHSAAWCLGSKQIIRAHYGSPPGHAAQAATSWLKARGKRFLLERTKWKLLRAPWGGATRPELQPKVVSKELILGLCCSQVATIHGWPFRTPEIRPASEIRPHAAHSGS